jgi:group I intron endonuclease
MNAKYLIYGLVDPRDRSLRYIGKSSQGLQRAREHCYPSYLNVDHSYCGNWIRKLQSLELSYTYITIEEFEDADILSQAEIFWISYFRAMGCRLTNMTLGGEGSLGYTPSQETRVKISLANKGKVRSASHSAAISAAKIGKSTGKRTEECKRKMSNSHKNSKKSKENSERRRRPIIDQYGNVYSSIKAAAQQLGVKPSNISAVLSGARKIVKGFQFSYI